MIVSCDIFWPSKIFRLLHQNRAQFSLEKGDFFKYFLCFLIICFKKKKKKHNSVLGSLEIASGFHHVSGMRYLIKSNSDSFRMAEGYSFPVFFLLPWAQIFRSKHLRNHLQAAPMSSKPPFSRIQKFTQALPAQKLQDEDFSFSPFHF